MPRITKERSEKIRKVKEKREAIQRELIDKEEAEKVSKKILNTITSATINKHVLSANRTIELSVGLPLFRSKYIAWLALESLCRQKNIDFFWELVAAEEMEDEALTEEEFIKYKDRLEKVGCAKITYIGLNDWIPLSRKYNLIVENCSATSKIYCGCAADLFPPPKRLKTQYDFFMDDPELDWCANAMTISYDISTERTYLHDLTMAKVKKKNDGSNKALRMEIMRNLPKIDRKKYLDGWIWKSAETYLKSKNKEFKTKLDMSDGWKYGLSVNGLNNISLDRHLRFDKSAIKKAKRIRECPIDINTTIPEDIMDRLRRSKKYVELHKKGLPK